MKDKKIAFISISVMIVSLLIAGGTYAWWTWTSSDAEKTAVNFTVPDGSSQLSATLDMDNTNFRGLAPAATCAGRYSGMATVTLDYSNQTTATAAINATLSLVSVTGTHTGEIDRSQIHWALSANPKETCASAIITNGTGTLSGVTDGGAIYTGDLAVGTINTNTSASKTLYLYFWIDPEYNFENVGNSVVTDPMQDMTIQVVWTGSISNAQAAPTENWVYTANDGINTKIGETISVTTYQTPEDAMTHLRDYYSGSNIEGVASYKFQYFFAHLLDENDKVLESYIGFVITDEMAYANPGMTAGTYYLKGGDTGAGYNNNKAELTKAFGSSLCNSDSSGGYFYCPATGLRAYAGSDGMTYIDEGGSYQCKIWYNGTSQCAFQ